MPALRTKVRHFNGKLFHDATALPLNADQVTLLQLAADADWTLVEPAIFGTLLERALDLAERHSLGAHYIPRRYVERLVLPAVIEPLRQEWAAAQAASAQRLEEGKGKKAVDEARTELLRYLRPAYQAPDDEQQATLTLPSTAATPTAAIETGPQPWPAGLA